MATSLRQMQQGNTEDMEKEAVELEYNGKTITAYVDKAVAETLKNDPVQKQFYSKSVLEALEKNTDVKLVQVNKKDEGLSYEVHEKNAAAATLNTNDRISWTKEGTALLIKLRKDMKELFDEKNSMKKILWDKIAQKLAEAGFNLGYDPAERCRQKFVNIRHQYHNYLQYMYNPEKKRKRPQNKYQNFFESNSFSEKPTKKKPPFFDDMREILSDNTIPAKIPQSENVYQIEYYNKTLEEFLVDDDEENACEEEDTSIKDEENESDKLIWTVGAINLLIRFRGEMDTLFKQEHTKPEILWSEIAKKLKNAGFDLGEHPEEKCQIKFENLKHKYEKHKELILETNSSPIMPFYQELDKILGKDDMNEYTTTVYKAEAQDSAEDENCETIIFQTVADDSDDNENDVSLLETRINESELVDIKEYDKFLWDPEAVLMLIKLREELASLFDTRSNQKKLIWNQIANKLNLAGYDIGNGERCRQKFANLKARYYHHVNSLKSNSNKTPPPFFKEMHSLMKKLGKADEEEEDEEDEQMEIRNNKKRFKGNSERLIDVIIKLHKEDQKERRQQFNELKALLKKQTEQQERLLNILEQSLC